MSISGIMALLRMNPTPIHQVHPYIRIILLVTLLNCGLTILFFSHLLFFPNLTRSHIPLDSIASSVKHLLRPLASRPNITKSCVEGHRETLASGYTIEVKCNISRQGVTYDEVSSYSECAAICESLDIDVCSYHPPSRRCVVSSLHGRDIPRDGVYYMTKVTENDPEDIESYVHGDPFEEVSAPEMDACIDRIADLETELEHCRSETIPPTPLCGVEGIAINGRIDMIKATGVDACKAICLANPLCQAYSASDDPEDCIRDEGYSIDQFLLELFYPQEIHCKKNNLGIMSASDSVVYHYLAIGKLGRGEVVKLFMIDAGIKFEERLYARDDTWPETKEKLKKQGLTRTGQLPSVEYKGKVLTGHVPILRYLSRELGAYDGTTNDDKYLVDLVSDIYVDWRVQWVANLKGLNPDYKEKDAPPYYELLGQYYAEREGPYLLGDTVSYADFAVYVSLDNDIRTKTLPETLPESIVKFRNAFEARPNIVDYIKQG
ncbi:glutathione S-transferase P 10 [Fusarium pseudoanthophilum]|uniref:Glutathione S-transferase P 10 n=1 Tax=Fusarium pseudoanthophilum TaxID=48495 RepID=A0A8H5PC97_9HYPO|nr:glutathione S-transferase P 10 [Fusarium pseudoanthophilum]